MTDGGGLKLRARDPGGLDVIAALLQDALVPLTDAIFLKSDKRFILVVNRFKWPQAEDKKIPAAPATDPAADPEGNRDAEFEDAEGEPPYERVNCGICFERVLKVRAKNVDLSDRQQILNLLTITSDAKSVTLLFSGGAAIRLEVSALNCHIEDLGEGWLTRWRPVHDDPGADDNVAG
jgi:hypothetical protein